MFVGRSLIAVIGCCVVVAAMGCGGSGNFATVKGTVSHKGNPVDGAKVEFHGTTQDAEKPGKSDIFVTQTDNSGKYVISGVGKNPGIPPGMYKVVISKYEGNIALTGPEGAMDAGQLEAQRSDLGGNAPVQKTIKNHLPDEYASLATTKLSTVVEAGKNENVNFDLP
jgi:hypothetical protein